MKTIILTIHIIVSIILILLVILQAGKDSIGTVFGGSNAGTVFGGGGADKTITKLTAWFALFFFITSLAYTYVVSKKEEKESVIINIESPIVKEEQS